MSKETELQSSALTGRNCEAPYRDARKEQELCQLESASYFYTVPANTVGECEASECGMLHVTGD